jgi:ankyrin repeat protein
MQTADVLKRYEEEDLPEFVEIPLRDVNQRGNFGNTPLHVASVRGNLEEINALLDGGAEINARGERGDTPLHDAAEQGHLHAVERLLAAGAAPDIANIDGKTPRDLASLVGQDSIIAAIDKSLAKGRAT